MIDCLRLADHPRYEEELAVRLAKIHNQKYIIPRDFDQFDGTMTSRRRADW
jgi:hypothetical protein